MIKIDRIPAPEELTPEVVKDKTERFKADPKINVWNNPYIKDKLMEMSHGKCAYCECKLNSESKYMEVEHFHNKNKYPDEVVSWDNLLPACKSCNGTKNDHDTVLYPIVNPTVDKPGNHLAFRHYRYVEKDNIGRETIVALNLNDSERKCLPRFMVCNSLEEKLDEIENDLNNLSANSSTQAINKLKNKMQGLLQSCQSDREYTAIKASVMAAHPKFIYLVDQMKANCWWTPMMDEMKDNLYSHALDLV